MKLYLSLADIYEGDPIAAMSEAVYREGGTKEALYLFLVQYGIEVLKQIVELRCQSSSFLSFVKPNAHLVLTQLIQLIGRDKLTGVRMACGDFHHSDQSNLIRFFPLLEAVEACQRMSSLSITEFAQRAKISLQMNEIGNALILIEV